MNEIGSEFYHESCEVGVNCYFTLMTGQKEFVLSGRTGLGYIAEDLKLKYKIQSIALPAYCCGSMVEPFISKNIEVRFYESSSFQVIANTSDCVLIMDYFGFSNEDTLRYAEFCRRKSIPLVVDATQTAFSKLRTYELCDYLVCSYRKWTDCLCAAVYCRDGFRVSFSHQLASEYIRTWRKASRNKMAYVKRGIGEKQQFLDMYSKANRLLVESHEHLSPGIEEIQNLKHISTDFLRERRRENARFLIENIKKQNNCSIRLVFSHIEDEDCPLFLPILLPENKRMDMRSKLIDAMIYCPIHWSVDRNYPYLETNLHHQEMSLICDQRYDLHDMERMLSVLNSF